MKLKKTYYVVLLLLVPLFSIAQSDYYYYNGEQVHLTINKQYVNIVTANAFDETQLNAISVQPYSLLNEDNIRNGEYKKNTKLEFSSTIINQAEYEQKVNELKSLSDIESVNPYYSNNGQIFGASNFFTVKLKQPADSISLQSIAGQKNVDIDHRFKSMPLWYVLSTNNNTQDNTLDICAYFYETGLFEIVEPAFTETITIDPLTPITNQTVPIASLETCYSEGGVENQQWNLFNNEQYPLADINVCGAWEVTKGHHAQVAVLDTGITPGSQSDLPFNPNTDIVITQGPLNGNYYYTNNKEHGTHVAGIIGALHDGNWSGGIAPDARILYLVNKHSYPFVIADAIANIPWDNPEIAVLNLSLAQSGQPSTALAEALDFAIDNGHYSTGTADYGMVIVAGAGNEAAQVRQPANHPRVLAVGGSYISGEYNYYGHGSELDLVAPSGDVPTTAFGGGLFSSFGGTSAAAPHVAGIAALMVSANNEVDSTFIKAEAIRNIIRRTAQKADEYPYESTWNFISASTGSWNDHMGYGIPDATASVLAAEQFITKNDVLDLHIRNSLNDYGKEPDNVTRHANNVLWNSPDIWVRNIGDYSYEHQNPIKEMNVSVFVRVINKSNDFCGSANVELYWSKLGGQTANWPSHWDGSTSMVNDNGGSILIGDLIGEEDVDDVAPGEEYILEFTWNVPDPADFDGIFGSTGNNEFGLLARINDNDDPMNSTEIYYDLDNDGVNESGNVWLNTKNNNNIAWKNIEVVNPEPTPKSITLINNSNESKEYTLEFFLDDNPVGNAIFEEAEVKIQMDSDLFEDWTDNGAAINNFEIANQVFLVTEDDAIIDNIVLEAGEIRTLPIMFNFLSDELSSKKKFNYHYVQRDKETENIIYGKTFLIKKGEALSFDADAGGDKEVNKNESVTLSATSIDEPATYNWYDPEGNLIYTGLNFTLSPELTKKYTLEIIKDEDGLKDYDEVTVEVNPFIFSAMSPNPAINEVLITYIAEDADSAYFMFTEQTTGNASNYILDTQQESKTIDVSTYPTGIYLVSLICDGNLIETKQLIIN